MLNLIPKPNGRVVEKSGKFKLPSTISVLSDFESWCDQAFLERTKIKRKVDSESVLILSRDINFENEEYNLFVSQNEIRVKAKSERGVILALATAFELSDENGEIPQCEIADCPKFAHRGLSFDCSRHFFAIDEVKKIIEQMSLSKMSVLHWHLSDDQAFRIESKNFPLLASDDFYTQEQIVDIVEFARIRGVEIIPEIDMPGHTLAMLEAYPKLGCFEKSVQKATEGGIYTDILCAGKEETFEFIEKLLEEVCSLFISDKFHIGGDEAPKFAWENCPNCQKRLKDNNLLDMEQLQGYFSKRVSEILKKYGKSSICWNESLNSRDFSTDNLVQLWTVTGSKLIAQFVKRGGKFIYSNMFEIYFDYPYCMSPLKKVYHTQPKVAGKNYEKSSALVGIEACLWTERISDNTRLEQMLFPRVFAIAEVMWTNDKSYKDFVLRLPKKLESLKKAKMNFTPLELCNPKGKARAEETRAFFATMTKAMEGAGKTENLKSSGIGFAFAKNFVFKFCKLSDIPHLLKSFKK